MGHHRRYGGWRRLWPVAVIATVLLVGVAVFGYGLRPHRPGPTAGSDGPTSTVPSLTGLPATPRTTVGPAVTPTPSPTSRPGLLFGIGAEADSALGSPLARRAPVHLLSSWYNGPNDLSWLAGWRTGTVPKAYAAGYALHLIVYSGDSEGTLTTAYGPACGRAYPLSTGFTADMTQLAHIFAGSKQGPPLYVTMFTEFQTYPCQDNAWSPDAETTHYYQALQDQYRSAYAIFHRYAPNARVSLGWGGWQASYDDPAHGGGRSLFPHFADLLRGSDFQSFQAMDSHSNVADITQMVSILGQYGPVMLAHYKPDNGSQSTFDTDVHTILTDQYLKQQIGAGLFAMSFMDSSNLGSAATLSFVAGAVTRYGRRW